MRKINKASTKRWSLFILTAAVVYLFFVLSSSQHLQPIEMEDMPLSSPLAVNTRPARLAIGSSMSVAIKRDGTIWTWGSDGSNNLLARAAKSNLGDRQPQQVEGFTDAVAVDAWNAVLVLRRDGSVWGWGDNGYGQLNLLSSLGENFTSDNEHFVKIAGLPKMTAIDQAGGVSAGLDENGVIWAWGGGKNTLFDVDGGIPEHRPPTPIPGLPRIVKFSASPAVIAAIDESGRLWTVGKQLESARARSLRESAEQLIGQVSFPARVVDVDLGAFRTGMVLLENGQVWTWGDNHSGQLGLGHTTLMPKPARVESISRVKAIKAWKDFMVALTEDGDLLYWGALYYKGGFGFHEITRRNISSPTVLQSGVRATELAAGSSALAYLDEDGAAWYFGWNRYGERGTGRAGDDFTKTFVLTPEKSLWSH